MYLASVHYFQTKSETFLVHVKKNNIFILKPRISEFPPFTLLFLTCCPSVPQPTFGLLLRGEAQSSSVDVLLLLFLLEDQKELHEEVRSWWSAQRGLNWQHSSSYIMPQLTDLFCHTVLIFVKSKMLLSFNPLTRKYWGNI